MTDQENRFVEEYCVDCKRTDAARRAGYSANRAKQTAWELYNREDIRQAIDERLKLLAMPADEAIKHVADIARTRLNDYLVVKKELRGKMVRKPLQSLIDELLLEIEREEKFFEQADLSDKEQDDYFLEQEKRKRQLLRYRIELEQNPKATRDVKEIHLEQHVHVDLVALARANELGNIQELSWTEFGPKVKLYSAQEALALVLKLHGLPVDKIDVQSPIDLSRYTPEEIKQLAELALRHE